MTSSVVAVIPTFRPDPSDLARLVTSLAPQVARIVVADDASPCTADPVLHVLNAAGVDVRRHRRNAGIARSLNDGLAAASAIGAPWLLTVDQDTTLAEDHVSQLLAAAAEAEFALGAGSVGAVAAGSLDDASGTVGYPVTMRGDLRTTEEVFQSGTLWSVDALARSGGFDERLGIDGVDAAACLALRKAGSSILLAPGLTISHHYGAGRQYRLLGRQVVSTGHSPARRESMVRNRLRLLPGEFTQSPRHAMRTIRRVGVNTALGATVESDRWANLKGSARGLLPRRTR